jgi:hypothetical protein
MRALLLTCLFTVTAAAQTVTVNVPNLPGPVNVDRPFGGGIGRYQQWYNINGFGAITEPMRFDRLEFLTGTNNGSAPQPVTLNCEVLMGHGKFSGVFGSFDGNWDSPPIVVGALANRSLTLTGTGQPCLTVPFTSQFTWDKVRPILVEIRIFGNNQSNLPFLFNCQGTTSSLGLTTRVYAAGNAGATSGTVQQGVGMITRMRARPGMMLEFGTGCPGEGGVIPQQSANLAWPGITWNHNLSQAASQRTALWVIGDNANAPFPVDLTSILGLAPSGCMLRTNPANVIPVLTVGGGAGAGSVMLPLALPATTNYVGMSVFTQWVVLDPLAPNGSLSTTPLLWTIIAPVGG